MEFGTFGARFSFGPFPPRRKIMQRNVTRTAQLIDLCPDCRSVLKLAVIKAHPNHDELRIYHLKCENCGKFISSPSRFHKFPKADRASHHRWGDAERLRPDQHIG